MRKKILIVAISLLVAGIISGLAVVLISFNVFPHNQFDKQLRAAIHKNQGGVVQIANLTPFSWDRMYVYTPYSQVEEVNGEKIDVDEGSCALLFKEKGKTTCLLVFHRRFVDFSGESREEGYTPEEAIFSVQAGDWPALKWAPKKVTYE